MKGQIAQAFEKRLAPLTKRIENLEQRHSIEGVADIAWQCAEEDDIRRQLHALGTLAMQAGSSFSRTVQKKLQSLEIRLTLIPFVPRIEVILFAQTILALKPVILVTDDTFNKEKRQLELTRIFLMELTETPCFDYQFPSFSHENDGPPTMDKGTDANVADPFHATLKNVWTDFHNKLHGRYVVAFDLPFVQIQLAVTAQRSGLSVPLPVGHSLLDLLLMYARIKEPTGKDLDPDDLPFSDAQLCGLLAKEDVAPFVDLSLGSADQRALHLLHALQAMTKGALSLQEPLSISTLTEFTDPFPGKAAMM
jgi:hypothetical protein